MIPAKNAQIYEIHSPLLRGVLVLCCLSFLLISIGCSNNQAIRATIPVELVVGNESKQVDVPRGDSVQTVLDKAGITLGNLDRVDPPVFSLLTSGTVVRVVRVKEEFAVVETVVAFDHQTVRNESLPNGQSILIQPGVNGMQQTTYRILFEDGKETSRTVFKTVTLTEARPEIVMVGVQAPFSPLTIPGRIAYLSTGNAWVMEGSTGNRSPLVTTGDLDGHIFTLSSDGQWLLYTRKAGKDEKDTINTLWVAQLGPDAQAPLQLRVKNVVQHAAWVPDTNLTITYSTVEPRSTAPGWQANNDLHLLGFNNRGIIGRQEVILPTNSGGVYGWWGTTFTWSPDGQKLAYGRPDSVGIVDFKKKELVPLLELLPLQTTSAWAWVPGLNWTADHSTLYTVGHGSHALSDGKESAPQFDLMAMVVNGTGVIPLVPESGMFAYPVPSPLQPGKTSLVAYLQAAQPEQSETSRYRLMVMDRDGSNRRIVFPDEGATGLEPQQVVWSPPGFEGRFSRIGLIYQGNLWIVDANNNQAHQVTGDGLISRLAWN